MSEPYIDPGTGPVTPALVRAHLDNLTETAAPGAKLQPYCDAVNAWVRTLPVWAISTPPTPAVILGATMVVARYWRRRGSPGGIDQLGGDAGPIYVARYDPDAARLLQLNRPQVG